MLAVYVSGHGFGHATRTAEALRVLREVEPSQALAVVSAAPERLFRSVISGPFLFRSESCDVGLVQRDALEIDLDATASACRVFFDGFEARAEREARWLREIGCRLVLGDVPPLAFESAARAGVRSVGLANFTWDWIYAAYSRHSAELVRAASLSAEAYAHADLLLELPFAGDNSAFRVREPLPLLARRPRLAREEARRRIGEGEGPLVLVSFGGAGAPVLDLERVGRIDSLRFVTPDPWPFVPANSKVLAPADLAEAGLGYEDLVAACDAVVSKPGYGIVTDAIAGRARLLYTDRGDFPEYPILVSGMQQWLTCEHIPSAALRGGEIEEPLRRLLARPPLEPADLSGADAAARRILAMLGR